MKGVTFLIFATLIKCAYSEFFSSIEELKSLSRNSESLIDILKKLSNDLENKSILVKRKLKEIEDEHALMMNDVEKYAFNPLNAFYMIKHLSYDINWLEKCFALFNDFSVEAEKLKLPPSELSGAVEGLSRLQETYELKSEHLAKGVIYNKRYRKEMSPSDILVLAKEMMKFEEKYAFEYIDVAKNLNSKNDAVSKIEFLEELFEIYNSTHRYNEAVEVLDEIIKLDMNKPKYEERRLNVELLSLFDNKEITKKSEINESEYRGSSYSAVKEKLIFSKACAGKLKKSISELSKLHCRYVSNNIFTKIAPFKVIEANLEPFIGIYLDVISDNEIEILKSLSRNNLARAEVLAPNSTSNVSRVRVAQLNWHDDTRHEVLQTLTKRVSDMSGLDMKTAEQWQIQNYGIGGFYGPHHDFVVKGQNFQDDRGNRIATTLFYLSDVEKGGGTVFPFLHIHVPPRKGTAVFWYNLSSSGDREYMTRHAACPVLIGSKWVANKWLRETGQAYARPCELIPRPTDDDYYKKVYNLQDYGIRV